MRQLRADLTLVEVVVTPLLCLTVVLALLLAAGAAGPAGRVFLLTLLCASVPALVIAWSIGALQSSTASAVTEDSESPQTIATVGSDLEAALIVRELAGYGIRAMAVRGDSMGLQAIAPRRVEVMVTRENVARAEGALRGIRQTAWT
jgi:hypothetical protein